MNTLPPAGWFEDPDRPGALRYWDGAQWTDARHEGAPTRAAAPAAFAPAVAARSGDDVAATLAGAGWWRRAVAVLVDACVLAVIIIAVVAVAGDGDTADTIVGFVLLGGLLVYPWLWMGLDGGRTLGKRALGIRVVARDGEPIRLGRAFLREIPVKGVLGLFGLPLLVSYLWPLWETNQRALHDLMADTRVVRSSATAAVAAPGDAPPEPVNVPAADSGGRDAFGNPL